MKTHLSWSKKKGVRRNKLCLDVFAKLEEKRLLKMSKHSEKECGIVRKDENNFPLQR